jgi:HlyD family secretion protein
MARQIFRQAALDRLSSPEQLDRIVPVSDAFGWVTLSTLLMLLSAIIAWGIFGHIPDQVSGKGIFVTSGGRILDAMAPSDGTVVALLVERDGIVEKGQEIAVIEQDALRQEFVSAQEVLAGRLREREVIERNFEQEITLKSGNFEKQRAAQEGIIRAAQARADSLSARLAILEAVAAKGYVKRDQLDAKTAEYNASLQDISAARNRILELESDLLSLRTANTKSLTEVDLRIAEARHRVRELESRLTNESRVLAPTSGRVTELKVFEGAVVRRSTAIASIATDGQVLQAMMFVPTADGKRVVPGMIVHLAPSTVKKEEFGALIGQVIEVSDYPATREGMLSILQNDQLVAAYSEEGAPYAARVDLLPDAAAENGYRWTSGTGPPVPITAGTTLEAEITVSEDPPVNLILPFIRKHTGIGFWSRWTS